MRYFPHRKTVLLFYDLRVNGAKNMSAKKIRRLSYCGPVSRNYSRFLPNFSDDPSGSCMSCPVPSADNNVSIKNLD